MPSEETTPHENSPRLSGGIISRRRCLTLVGGALASGLLAPADSLALPFFKKKSACGYEGFLGEYARYLSGLRLRHIKVNQIIDAHLKTRGRVKNTPPPRSMWKSVAPVLRIADRLVSELDVPLIEIVSAYRSPSYNARCAGARRKSMHLQNMALDLRYSARPSQVAAAAEALRKKGKFSGGIGRYGTFTHIDTRGSNVNWRGW